MNSVTSKIFLVAISSLFAYVCTLCLVYSVSGLGTIPSIMHVCIVETIVLLFVSSYSNRPQPLFLLICLYLLLFFLIPGAMHCRITTFPFFETQYSDDNIAEAVLIVATFISFFAIGYYVKLYRSLRQYAVREIVVAGRDEKTMYLPAVLLCAVVSISAGLIAGPSAIFTSRGDLVGESSPVEIIVIALSRICSFLSFMYSIFKAKCEPRGANTSLLWLTFILFCTTNLPTAIPRFLLASYAITFLLTFYNLSVKGRLTLIFFALIAQFTIFPMLSELARGDLANLFDLTPLNYLSTHGDFDGLQSTTSIVLMVKETGLKWGHQLLSAILFFVPRTIWPGKSIGTGGEAADFMGFVFNNLSAPLPAEFYVDFGYFGLIPASLMVGWCSFSVDSLLSKETAFDDRFRIIASLICGYSFIIMRGALVGTLGPVVLSVGICILVNCLFLRHKHIDPALLGPLPKN